jgi:hypothetical protein
MKQRFDEELRNDRFGLAKYGPEKKRLLTIIILAGAASLIISIVSLGLGSLLEL